MTPNIVLGDDGSAGLYTCKEQTAVGFETLVGTWFINTSIPIASNVREFADFMLSNWLREKELKYDMKSLNSEDELDRELERNV